MKLGSRGGHTKASTGASHYIDELTEDRILIEEVNDLLSSYNTMVNCQPSEDTPYPQELSYGINKANNNRVDLFFSIHFNAAGVSNNSFGCEVILHPSANTDCKNKAQKICDNLATLGFKNRGIKYNSGLGELSNTTMSAMIIEVCFVTSKADTDLYNSLSKDIVARAIANGIDSRVDLSKNNSSEGDNVEMKNPVNDFNERYYLYSNADVAEAVRNGSYVSGEEHFIHHGYSEGRIYKMDKPSDWSEVGYLINNQDVANAIEKGDFKTGFEHYSNFGFYEGRSYKVNQSNEFDRDKLIKEVSEIIKNF